MEKIEPEEIWVDVENFEGYYQVSNLGKVRSLPRPVKTKGGGILNRSGAIMKQTCRNGYLYVHLCKDDTVTQYCVHRLVAQAFIPNPEKKPIIDHLDGVKFNNVYTNLEWVTYQENTVRAYRSGQAVAAKGEKHGVAKLTEEDVRYIKVLYKRKISPIEISDLFDVTTGNIESIVSGKTWKHVEV